MRRKTSPVLLPVERLRGIMRCVDRCLFPSGFWSCFMVPSWFAQSYIAELRSSPRWLPHHRNLSIFSVTLNPLHSFRLTPLNVFIFGLKKKMTASHLDSEICYFQGPNQKWQMTNEYLPTCVELMPSERVKMIFIVLFFNTTCTVKLHKNKWMKDVCLCVYTASCHVILSIWRKSLLLFERKKKYRPKFF